MATIEDSAPGATKAGTEAGVASRDGQALHVQRFDGEDGVEPDEFKPLTREQALLWRASQPHASVWSVLGWQLVLAVLAACVAAALTRSQPVVVSLLYGAGAVVLPTGLMAWGLTKGALSRRAAGGAQASLAGFFVWEGAKILLAIALLALAPRLVPNLSWLALVAGLVVVLKAYWLELWFRARRLKRNSELV
ncbi:ATP synthase subunit I [Hydrogenophaga sp. OTU3427]|uniref:ATP synthase subunit I n=1 Tax=Hydrogenophaga sp. OTU3427 TaxID=3043856 RepID=UPI00313DBC71